MSAPAPLARQLLDAQVAFHLARLSGQEVAGLSGTVGRLAEELLDATGRHQLGDLVQPEDVTRIVTRALATVPGSPAVRGIVELVTDVLHDGPDPAYPVGELVQRERVEALVDELLDLSPALERALEQLVASPLVGTVASRFMGRVVGEVVQANQAVANRVPGLGSLMSLGTSAASRVVGAADKQLEGLLGDAAGRGGTFAVRRLNRIIVETLRDPTTRDAVLEVWDLVAAAPVTGMDGLAGREEIAGVVDAGHELVVSAAATEPAARLGQAIVTAFFDRFGGYTPTELLAELELDRDDLVADLVRIAPGVLEAMLASGDLEQLLRSQLEPFYASPEVTALLTSGLTSGLTRDGSP